MANIKLAERKINNLIRKTIVETIQEVLQDPDRGLELQAWVKERLRKAPQKLIPFDAVKKKYL